MHVDSFRSCLQKVDGRSSELCNDMKKGKPSCGVLAGRIASPRAFYRRKLLFRSEGLIYGRGPVP